MRMSLFVIVVLKVLFPLMVMGQDVIVIVKPVAFLGLSFADSKKMRNFVRSINEY